MKVLHVIPSLSQVHGGPTRALEMMEKALAAQGIAVETAATNDDGPHRINGKPLDAPLDEGDATRWYFGKRTDFYKAAPDFPGWARRNFRRFDIVHVHALFSFMSTTACIVARHQRVPYIVRPLGTLAQYGIKARRPWTKALSLKWVEGPILHNAAAVHFTDESEMREAKSLGIAMTSRVVPLATELGAARELRKRDRSAAVRLVFLSRLDPKKNLEGLLDALALTLNDAPGFELQVAGSGEAGYVDALKQRAQSLGIDKRVTWLGHVSGEAKDAAFARADIFVLPSFSENFGIAAAEALGAGLPCVLGEGVAIAQKVADAGAGLATSPQPGAIAAALRRMIVSEDALEGMSGNARRLAEAQYSLEAMGVRLKNLYAEVLAR